MIYIFIALLLFLSVVIIHLLLCRQFTTNALTVRMFLGVAIAGLVALFIIFDLLPLDSHIETLSATSIIIYLFLNPIYMYFYFKINQVTPSKNILIVLKENPKATYDELLLSINSSRFVEQSLQELLVSGHVGQKEGKYFLTPVGRSLSWFIKFDRCLF